MTRPRPWARLVALQATKADQRSARQIYDDPNTPESYLLGRGIRDLADLAAAAARPDKSRKLIKDIRTFTLRGALDAQYANPPLRNRLDDTTIALTREPLFSRDDLRTIARFIGGALSLRRLPLLTAVCGHPLADADILESVLRFVSATTNRAVATATGREAVTAVGWVCAHNNDRFDSGLWGIPELRVATVAGRWASWTSGSPARAAFLLNAAHLFSDEEQMFAVGEAVTAAPR